MTGVSISGQIGTVTGDIIGGNQINYGLDAEALIATLETRGFIQKAEHAGLPRQTVIALAQRLKPGETLDLDQAVHELQTAVDIALNLIAHGERTSNDGAFVDAILARVAAQTRHGDLDAAATTLDQALADLEATRRHQRLTLLEQALQLDTLRRDAQAAARRIEQIAATDHETDRPAWSPPFQARVDNLFEEGTSKGINFSLAVTIELARTMHATAHDSGERGDALIRLGNALSILGDRETGTARLHQAVAAYTAALEEYPRERVPLEWATTQNNLGNALRSLGQREAGTAQLNQAVSAYTAALEEIARDRAPLDWAATQNNLGNALATLGERRADTTQLDQAVAAYTAALEERTRARVPLEWAMTQSNLGNALQTLGELETGTARLQQAVTAYTAALQEHTPERVPLDWAMTQNNLGNALQVLGQREDCTARLNQAVAAFTAALTERTRERVPLDWAATQNNLGNTLRILGQRDTNTTLLNEAVAAYTAALTELTRDRVPHDWAITQNNLGKAHRTLADRDLNPTHLDHAIAAWNACLSVTADVWPTPWLDEIRQNRDTAQTERHRRE